VSIHLICARKGKKGVGATLCSLNWESARPRRDSVVKEGRDAGKQHKPLYHQGLFAIIRHYFFNILLLSLTLAAQ
jgi:hypothetical protein